MAAGGCPVEQYNTAEPEATRAPCPRGRPGPCWAKKPRRRRTPWSRCARAPPNRPSPGLAWPPTVGGAGGEASRPAPDYLIPRLPEAPLRSSQHVGLHTLRKFATLRCDAFRLSALTRGSHRVWRHERVLERRAALLHTSGWPCESAAATPVRAAAPEARGHLRV